MKKCLESVTDVEDPPQSKSNLNSWCLTLGFYFLMLQSHAGLDDNSKGSFIDYYGNRSVIFILNYFVRFMIPCKL